MPLDAAFVHLARHLLLGKSQPVGRYALDFVPTALLGPNIGLVNCATPTVSVAPAAVIGILDSIALLPGLVPAHQEASPGRAVDSA